MIPELPPTNGDSNFPRIRTGNPQADDILGGGFPRHSINIVMGDPGTGKTIFAEQLLFHNAQGERPLLYVTTLSEPLAKVVSYVQRFSFFDSERLGADIHYEDLGRALSTEGPQALLTWLDDAIKTRSPQVIVIDSFRAIHDLAMASDDMRAFMSKVAGLLSAYEVTVFLLGEYTRADISRFPEFAVADSIVELARQPMTTRDERFMRVLKLRGSSYREGQHAFRVTSHGLEIYPRLVAPRIPEEYEILVDRMSTGVEGLDRVMSGGPFAGSTTLVVGATGSGKTTLALQFALEGVRRGEQAMFINFQESPAQIRRAITNLGYDPATMAERGLELIYASPVELQIDSIVATIFETIRSGRVRRLVIDAIGDLATAADDQRRLHDYLYSLVQHFAARGVTTLLTLEVGEALTRDQMSIKDRFSYMSDNLVYLSQGAEGADHRQLRVVKMRGSDHDRAMHEFDIDATGSHVR